MPARRAGFALDRRLTALAAATLLACSAATAHGGGPGTVELAAADGTVAVRIPADWKVEERPSKTFALSAFVTVPGVENPFALSVYVLPRGRSARAQLWVDRPTLLRRFECDDDAAVSALEPLPHTALEWSLRGRAVRALYAYVVRRRRCFSVLAEDMDPAAWPALREPLFAVARSLTTTLPQQPPDPEGYTVKVQRGIRFLAHPDVGTREFADLRKRIQALRKDYESRHGALVIDAANPPMVIVHDAPGRARTLSSRAAESVGGQFFAADEQVLYVTPPGDVSATAVLARETVAFLHFEAYGHGAYWLLEGECKAALARALTGKRLPALPSEFGPLPSRLPPFDKQRSGIQESVYWVLFFRYGPTRYRKAFDAYLDDLRTTGDFDGAAQRHLLVLDQEAMQDAADAFVAKKVKLVEIR